MDVETVEKLVQVLSSSARLTEMEVRQGDITVRLRRPAPAAPAAKLARSIAAPTQNVVLPLASPTQPAPLVIASEFVGVFHASTQGVPQAGATVTAKQVLGEIETMRVMNPVSVPSAGRLQAVLVQDGQPVEYGQPLFEIMVEEVR